MTAIDNWIAELQQNTVSTQVQPVLDKTATVIAALSFIAGLIPSGPVVAQELFFGSNAATPVMTQSNKLFFDGTNLTVNAGAVVAADALLVLSQSNTVVAPAFSGIALGNVQAHLVGGPGLDSFLAIDSFQGAGALHGSNMLFRSARGTIAAPTALQLNDSVCTLFFSGANGAGTYSTQAEIGVSCLENWDGTHGGSSIFFFATPIGSAGQTQVCLMRALDGVATSNGTFLMGATNALTNAAGVGAGTITNAPTAGNPTKWIQINDAGTTRKIPTWT